MDVRPENFKARLLGFRDACRYALALSACCWLAFAGAPIKAATVSALERGCALMGKKHFQDALVSLTEAISDDDKDPMAYFRRGQCFFCLANYQASLDDFNHAIKLEKGVANFYVWRATSEARLNDDDAAIRDYEKAMRLDPGLLAAYKAAPQDAELHTAPSLGGTATNAGVTSEKTINVGRSAQALKDYAEAAKRVSDNVTAYFRLGTVFSGLQELDADGKPSGIIYDGTSELKGNTEKSGQFRIRSVNEIVRSAESAISLNPSDAGAYYQRGLAFEQSAKMENAISDLERAIELKPREAKFRLAMAFLFNQMHEDEKAKEQIRQAQEADPALPEVILFSPPQKQDKTSH